MYLCACVRVHVLGVCGGMLANGAVPCVLGEGRVEQCGPRGHDERILRRIPASRSPCRLCQVA